MVILHVATLQIFRVLTTLPHTLPFYLVIWLTPYPILGSSCMDPLIHQSLDQSAILVPFYIKSLCLYYI
jgi:hypothetical protein